MNTLTRWLFAALLAFTTGAALAAPVKVLMKTNKGDIVLELNADKAPVSVANFLRYADEGFYDGTIFHRVIKGFMVQGGGYTANMARKDTHEPIENEAKNGLKNVRGSIAMARTGEPHSATAQFFINHVNNTNLDYPSFDGWGYAVFGKVVSGMEVIDAIATTPTGRHGPMRDVPREPIVIQSVRRIE